MAPFSPLPLGWTRPDPQARSPRPVRTQSRPFPHIFGQTLPTHSHNHSHFNPYATHSTDGQAEFEIFCRPEGMKWLLGLAITCLLMVAWLAAHPNPGTGVMYVDDEGDGVLNNFVFVDDLSLWSVDMELIVSPPAPMVGYGKKALGMERRQIEEIAALSSFSASVTVAVSTSPSGRAPTVKGAASISNAVVEATTKPSSPLSTSLAVSLRARDATSSPAPTTTTPPPGSSHPPPAHATSTTFSAPPQAAEPSAQKPDDGEEGEGNGGGDTPTDGSTTDGSSQVADPPKKDRRRSRNRTRRTVMREHERGKREERQYIAELLRSLE